MKKVSSLPPDPLLFFKNFWTRPILLLRKKIGRTQIFLTGTADRGKGEGILGRGKGKKGKKYWEIVLNLVIFMEIL